MFVFLLIASVFWIFYFMLFETEIDNLEFYCSDKPSRKNVFLDIIYTTDELLQIYIFFVKYKILAKQVHPVCSLIYSPHFSIKQ